MIRGWFICGTAGSGLPTGKPQVRKQGGNRADAPVEILQGKAFIRGMGAVVRASPSQEENPIQAERLLQEVDNGYGPPSRMKTGVLPKPISMARAAA